MIIKSDVWINNWQLKWKTKCIFEVKTISIQSDQYECFNQEYNTPFDIKGKIKCRCFCWLRVPQMLSLDINSVTDAQMKLHVRLQPLIRFSCFRASRSAALLRCRRPAIHRALQAQLQHQSAGLVVEVVLGIEQLSGYAPERYPWDADWLIIKKSWLRFTSASVSTVCFPLPNDYTPAVLTSCKNMFNN